MSMSQAGEDQFRSCGRLGGGLERSLEQVGDELATDWNQMVKLGEEERRKRKLKLEKKGEIRCAVAKADSGMCVCRMQMQCQGRDDETSKSSTN